MSRGFVQEVASFGEHVELPNGYTSVWRDYQRSFSGDKKGRLTPSGKREASTVFCPLFSGFGNVVSGTKERVQLVVSEQVINLSYDNHEKPGHSSIMIPLNPEQVTEFCANRVVRYRRNRLLGHLNGEVAPGLARDVLDVLFSFYELFTPVQDGNKHSAVFHAEGHELRSLPVDFPVEREFHKFYGASEKAGFAGLVHAYSSDSRDFYSYLDCLILKNVYEPL